MDGHEIPYNEEVDAITNLRRRWEFRNEWASNPTDFYTKALVTTMLDINRYLDEDTTILDIGCSSGEPLLQAVSRLSFMPRVVGIDPNLDSYQALPIHLKALWFDFVWAFGENTTLPSEIADAALMFDSIYRMRNKQQSLREVKRLLHPGGLLFIKTKGEGHAVGRYAFERKVGELVCRRYHTNAARIQPPASGAAAADIPGILAEVPGLQIIRVLRSPADNFTCITPERMPAFIDDIKSSVARTKLPHEHYDWWHTTVDEYVTPRLEASIRDNENATGEAVYKDPIDEVMFTVRTLSDFLE